MTARKPPRGSTSPALGRFEMRLRAALRQGVVLKNVYIRKMVVRMTVRRVGKPDASVFISRSRQALFILADQPTGLIQPDLMYLDRGGIFQSRLHHFFFGGVAKVVSLRIGRV